MPDGAFVGEVVAFLAAPELSRNARTTVTGTAMADAAMAARRVDVSMTVR